MSIRCALRAVVASWAGRRLEFGRTDGAKVSSRAGLAGRLVCLVVVFASRAGNRPDRARRAFVADRADTSSASLTTMFARAVQLDRVRQQRRACTHAVVAASTVVVGRRLATAAVLAAIARSAVNDALQPCVRVVRPRWTCRGHLAFDAEKPCGAQPADGPVHAHPAGRARRAHGHPVRVCVRRRNTVAAQHRSCGAHRTV